MVLQFADTVAQRYLLQIHPCRVKLGLRYRDFALEAGREAVTDDASEPFAVLVFIVQGSKGLLQRVEFDVALRSVENDLLPLIAEVHLGTMQSSACRAHVVALRKAEQQRLGSDVVESRRIDRESE